MCTAATYKTKDFYFGRTLDYEFSYNEQVTFTPRNFVFDFRDAPALKTHYAMIGMAYVKDGFPLYYEGTNEKGLCIAGLNFVGNAVYVKPQNEKNNIAQFEFIPWILGKCASVSEARELLGSTNITDTPFDSTLPCAELHWIIADTDSAITVESTKDGMKIYDNPAGVLTNNPTFDIQMFNLNNYMSLSPNSPENTFSDSIDLKTYSRGMGTLGLPGDLSSASRFVRAAFVRANSRSGESEAESVSQFFHILGAVDQQRGCCVFNGKYEITIYTSCCNANKGIYYYTTYDNHQISALDMRKENLDGSEISAYPLIKGEQIKYQN